MAQLVHDSAARVIEALRPVRPLYRESSLAAAVEAVRDSGVECVPVLDGPYLMGMLWADDIRSAALSGAPLTRPITDWVDEQPPKLLPNATVEEARSVLTASRRPGVAVADAEGRYIGVLLALDLYHRPEAGVKPPFIGGMATPFGVFLTNGDVFGGAGPGALVTTGAMLVSLFLVGIALAVVLLNNFGARWSLGIQEFVLTVVPSVVFLGLLRGLPLAGTHGAEHMVVHAIERREPLTPDVVRRMPRVHPRCGTNFAIGAMLFMWLVQVTRNNFADYQELGALFALVTTLVLWRPIGAIFQQFVTTKPPSDRQLVGAIKAGEELLYRYTHSPRPAPSFGKRLLMSGLPWVLLGSIGTYTVLYGLLWLFGQDPGAWLG